jgi:hypothetical protein
MGAKPRGRGQPSAYRPEFVDQARKLCHLGATDAELADFFGVTEMTVNNWKKAHPEFAVALLEAKSEADAKVVHALYRRALGYEHPAVKIAADPKTGDHIAVPYIEHYPPDTTACIFWLKNRQKRDWRDKQEVEHSGDLPVLVVRRET